MASLRIMIAYGFIIPNTKMLYSFVDYVMHRHHQNFVLQTFDELKKKLVESQGCYESGPTAKTNVHIELVKGEHRRCGHTLWL